MAKQEAKEKDEKPIPKLPLSKVVYGIGMSARDSWSTFVISLAVFTPLIALGSEKLSFLSKLADIPEKVQGFAKKQLGLGERAGKWGSSMAVAAGIGTLLGFFAHMPGLVRGPRKVAEAERMYEEQAKMSRLLAEDNAQLKEALTQAKTASTSMAERVRASTQDAQSHSAGL